MIKLYCFHYGKFRDLDAVYDDGDFIIAEGTWTPNMECCLGARWYVKDGPSGSLTCVGPSSGSYFLKAWNLIRTAFSFVDVAESRRDGLVENE